MKSFETKHEHIMIPSDNQGSTGKYGVRKTCSICRLTLTFYEAGKVGEQYDTEESKL